MVAEQKLLKSWLWITVALVIAALLYMGYLTYHSLTNPHIYLVGEKIPVGYVFPDSTCINTTGVPASFSRLQTIACYSFTFLHGPGGGFFYMTWSTIVLGYAIVALRKHKAALEVIIVLSLIVIFRSSPNENLVLVVARTIPGLFIGFAFATCYNSTRRKLLWLVLSLLPLLFIYAASTIVVAR